MAVVKANYVKKGREARARAKATVRYNQQRPGKDKEKLIRELFGSDGQLTREQVYRMVDEALPSTYFYRIVISPDPSREDGPRDMDLRALTIQTIAALEERLKTGIPFAAVIRMASLRGRKGMCLMRHALISFQRALKPVAFDATGQIRRGCQADQLLAPAHTRNVWQMECWAGCGLMAGGSSPNRVIPSLDPPGKRKRTIAGVLFRPSARGPGDLGASHVDLGCIRVC